MKLLLALLTLLFYYASEGDADKSLYNGATHWIDDKEGEGQYAEDSVYAYLKSPIYVIDSGKRYEVHSFQFVYKEVGVYENAQGKPEVMCDVRTAECRGNTIDTIWQKALSERLAWGDTLMFAEVLYRKGKDILPARGLKVYMHMPPKLRR